MGNFRIGDRVVRSPHWHYGNQDGGAGRMGTISGREHGEVGDSLIFCFKRGLSFPPQFM